MKIKVVNRDWIKQQIQKDPNFYARFNFISIFSSDSFSPFPNKENILKLKFDDVTDSDKSYDYSSIYFNKNLANEIKNFIENIKNNKMLIIHCDAGVSRSGAVGYVLNEYLNKFKNIKVADNLYFYQNNKQIQPNSLVLKILKPILFGNNCPYKIEVKDIFYNADGDQIIKIEKI